ncbi:hypothetical protein ILUMI_10977 [Ignelater luminosus]|uniref:Carboxypeptidase n=1 Tax=Ignelater luminosus TaxID=2038154 RepID=A0A8K0GAY3_IGNLU|nr:hypothetical protein ILUMI_10977 [Ignelater luminosus]
MYKIQVHDEKPNGTLILTPLINKNKIEEARAAAEVHFSDLKDIKSYSGYFTVDELYNSNLFFWFFPSKYNYEDAPVILWLQGGPGASSMFGLFMENGPLELLSNGTLKQREHSWNNNHSIIYIDNPVGTGFSYTDGNGYLKNQTAIGDSLYEALLQFFKLFPELQKNDFFATGESYGGKYVPAVSYSIHKNNPLSKQKINLKGLAIGNGWSDPKNHLVRTDYLYQLGLIDFKGKLQMGKQENITALYTQEKKWTKAAESESQFFLLFNEYTGFDNIYNYLIPEYILIKNVTVLKDYLKNPNIKKAIHVGDAPFSDLSGEVGSNLEEDIMKSVADWISELLDHYKVLFYNGQLDICVAYPLTRNFLQNLEFSGASQYKTAERHQWHVDFELAGYVKQAGNLTEIMVRDAGHMVPSDQPAWALNMITRFTHNIPFY